MKAIIDRFEENIAVVEIAGRMQNIPRRELPAGAREGDVLFYDDGKWSVSLQATAERKRKIDKLAEKLWQE